MNSVQKAQIPIEIRYPPQPVLFNSKNSELEDLVTICIKTFERYPCLNRLIESIEEKYPKLNIIVADDSFNYQSLESKKYQNLTKKLHSYCSNNKAQTIKPTSVLSKIISRINYLSLARSRIDSSISIPPHFFTSCTVL